jgi:hypothetical protein
MKTRQGRDPVGLFSVQVSGVIKVPGVRFQVSGKRNREAYT